MDSKNNLNILRSFIIMNKKVKLLILILIVNIQIFSKDYYGVRYSELAMDINHLDPIFSEDSYRWVRFAELINARLVTNNEKLQQYEDLLLKMPSAIEQDFNLELKEVINWKDGTPITTADIAFTFELYKASSRKEYLKVVDYVDVEIVDDKKIIFKKPAHVKDWEEFRNAINFYLPNIYILPKHIIQDIPLEKFGEYTKKPLGAGPYYINDINVEGEKVSITLFKNDFYHNEPVPRGIKEVEVVTENEIGNAISNLQKNTENCIKNGKNTCIDILSFSIDSRILQDDLDNQADINKYPYAENSWMGMAFNTNVPLLNNKEFRIIIDEIIDDEFLIKQYYNKMGTEQNAKDVTGPFHPDFGILAKNLHDRKSGSKEIINKLINGGFRIQDTNTDYLQVFNSNTSNYEDLQLVLIYDKSVVRETSTTRQVFTKIVKYFKSCKIKLILDGQDQKNFNKKVASKSGWDLAFKKYIFDWRSDLKPLFSKNSLNNITGYSSPVLDKLLEEYETYKTIDKINAGEKIHKHCYDNVPYLFLWTVKAKTYYRNIIKDVKITPMTFFGTINDWMVSPRNEN
ncbi:MAG: hypothetical protein CL824_02985 [Crocinitomicaceae bacterium]|nr:hypothetical protein [Crocinitomicaceae bacterium]|tara:strand:+ start:1001 stop:2716 length:1716 start_codon:yes stop_codon:yes gene_type:complete